MKVAILTLDIINDICHPKGKLSRYADRISSNNIIDNINQVTAWGRKKEHMIIHVRLAFHEHYLDCSTKSPVFSAAEQKQAFLVNEWGGQFCENLQIETNDVQIIKHRVSAFYGTDLDLILRANRIDHLVLTGVATNNAVELTAREAHDRDYALQIIEDATECASDTEKQASINLLSRFATWSSTIDLVK